MDLQLNDTQAAFREMAANFVDAEIVPHVREWDRREEVDLGVVEKLGALGFLGLTIPEEYGGVEADMLSYALVIEELGRGDSSVRGIVSVSLGLVAKSIATHGTPMQKQRWLPRLTSGQAIGCFALTEPESGSDAGSLATRARRDGDDWLLSGQKMFITNGTWAEVALVFARAEEGVTAFLVPTATPGFTANTLHGKLGLRGQATAELVLEDVRVPDSARLGAAGKGLGIALGALTKGRISVAAGAVGVAQAALTAAVRYAGERVQFGKPIAAHQLVQELLAESAVEVEAARLLTWRAAELAERGVPREELATASSMAKYHAGETAVRVANNALQVFGGYGYIDEYPVGKYLRDARVLTLYEGTSQVQKLIIGRSLTGVDALTG
ncbi:hypothetical protein A8924_4393 [Saccharopolyspora erythraea NRRL 2338]|uniref:Acyl-CoA dehydrogenase n=2 Tax=Saccharopolyspora erythraea TaxID=1836 RepID=A4FGV1_SACEN|nr:acyl-CoA dehydrogenase family protein [Saccharopolyspora erythraea]EQD82615.1 butyryl-CoA dehydrogenase [Saccharopolyspora erythraea D]PFG96980.1 hypothetical protein A8924_4393 [Saccharopolyspora erythraea NRRL 2338]QRK87196.1 acyl-CoA dehydrogenase family protein [Saccharopolyspora erythraea]CAM03276.1 putative acyl-CoA dehydrogenase [Saccharopolyspora erythraea NRRL 2338]